MKPLPPKPLDEEEIKYFQELEEKKELERKKAAELDNLALEAFKKKMEDETPIDATTPLIIANNKDKASTISNTKLELDKLVVVKKKEKKRKSKATTEEQPPAKKAKTTTNKTDEQSSSSLSLLAAYQDKE